MPLPPRPSFPRSIVPWWGMLAHLIMSLAMAVVPLAGVWTENVLWRYSPGLLSFAWITAAILCVAGIRWSYVALRVALPVVAALHATMGLGTVLLYATHYTADGAEIVRVLVTAAMHASFVLYAAGLAHWTARDVFGSKLLQEQFQEGE